ncbi:MAG: ribonuclease HI family protein [Candidatus Omnitrophota bacterium]|nr:MAG: ribonuclease HI family protein [Candidatus Omnitrophota bacterium]
MIEIYIDGACAGNPGKIGVGYLIYKNKKLIKKDCISLGVQTNNFAEYMALIFSLTDAISIGEKDCKVYSDSQLLCEQIKGKYRVKNNNILSLFILVKTIISKLRFFEITHIEREKNQEADKLAKKAVGFLE